MPLMPKKTKYRKMQKGRNRGYATRGNTVSNGEYGIQAVEAGLIKGNQIEAARIAMTRYTKRGGQVWIKIFPDKPITQKPAGTRGGKGKGNVEYWVAAVKPDRIMFEIAGVSEELAREAMRLASHKLPCKYIIHTVGPKWKGGRNGEEELLRSCYNESVKLALDNGCKSIAFPLISAGIYGYPKKDAILVAIDTLEKAINQIDMNVTLILFDKESKDIADALYN